MLGQGLGDQWHEEKFILIVQYEGYSVWGFEIQKCLRGGGVRQNYFIIYGLFSYRYITYYM